MQNPQLWIEALGNIIVARLPGNTSKSMPEEIHERVTQLLQDTGYPRVLYDGLEMDLARIAFGQFGEGEYRVFHDDLSQALCWLEE
jgi:hypothetical protein